MAFDFNVNYYEQPRVPGLPGVDDVTDGSVDYYDMEWENVENGATEEEMIRCIPSPCGPDDGDGSAQCQDNQPEQTDDETYEMILE